MKDIYCEYHMGLGTAEDMEKIKIIQTFGRSGSVIVGERSYPLTFGGLYFIGSGQNYEIRPENKTDYYQNCVMIDDTLFQELAALLECTKEYRQIFEKGSYLPVSHYKIIDSRMKQMNGVYKGNKPYAKAMLVSILLDLLSYGVYGKVYVEK